MELRYLAGAHDMRVMSRAILTFAPWGSRYCLREAENERN